MFAALPLRLAGVPLILDLHEAMPEFFRSRFPRASNPVAHRLLLIQERLSIAISSRRCRSTTRCATGWSGSASGRTRSRRHQQPVAPALRRGGLRDPAFPRGRRLRLIYTGGLTPTYEVDVAVRAVARLASDRPDLDPHLDIYGRGDTESPLPALGAGLGVGDR